MIRSVLVRRAVTSGVWDDSEWVSTATRPSTSDDKFAANAGVGTGGTVPSVRVQLPSGAARLPSPVRKPGSSDTRRPVIFALASQRMASPGIAASISGQDTFPSTASSTARSVRGGNGTDTRPVKSVPGPVRRQLTTAVIRRRLSQADVSQVTVWSPSKPAEPFHIVPDTVTEPAGTPTFWAANLAGIYTTSEIANAATPRSTTDDQSASRIQ